MEKALYKCIIIIIIIIIQINNNVTMKGIVEYWSNLTLVTKTCTITVQSNIYNFTMLHKIYIITNDWLKA